MSSTYGEKIKISVFGESHGNGIGVVIDGLPAGVKIDMDKVLVQMSRRAPGKDKTATPRKESDLPKVLSGMLGDTLTGAPLCAVIENTNTKSGDYGNLLNCPRPGHSDYTAYVKYNASNDIRGGGHFSGRITAPLVAAGAILARALEGRGIYIGTHILRAAGVDDRRFADYAKEFTYLESAEFPVLDAEAGALIRGEILRAAADGDSIGGILETAVTGLPAGVGDSSRFVFPWALSP